MTNIILANRYECLKKIGSGGMGDVYKAHDKRLDRIVAIKVLKSEYNEDDNFIRKFRRESLAAASISHPNIVSIYDVGMEVIEDSKMYYIVMEFIDGKTLKELVREEGMISQNQALNYLIQISEALKIAHSKNIVHRDIKSQNIMVTKDNRVKVTDFGIARMAGNSTVTVTNAVMGSVHYFSPEQARGQKVDARSDIYSMGIVLYEILTGEVPFDSENPITVALMHVQNQIPSLREKNPRVSPGVEQIFYHMTEKKPQDRYDNVSQIIEDVKSILLNKATPETGRETTMPIGRAVAESNTVSSNSKLPPKTSTRARPKKSPETEKKKKETSKFPAFAGALLALLLIFGLFVGVPKIKKAFDSKQENSLVVMENFVGRPVEEAQAFAEKNKLELDISRKETTDDVAENTILSQSIEESSKLKHGDKFSVVVAVKKEKVSLPNVKNMSVEEAQNRLKALGIEVAIDGSESSESVPKDRIISQEPSAGHKVEKGSTVHLIVSKGRETKLTLVPNLRGVSLDKANALLKEQGLVLGQVEEREDSTVGKGDVVWQQYESGNKVEVGTVVDIIISSGLPNSGDEENTENQENGEGSNAGKQNKEMNLNLELSKDDKTHEVKIVKNGSKTVSNFTAQGGESFEIPVTGVVGDQFDIYVDGQKMNSETVR